MIAISIIREFKVFFINFQISDSYYLIQVLISDFIIKIDQIHYLISLMINIILITRYLF